MDDARLCECARTHGTPLYVYDGAALRERASFLAALAFPFGLTVRYAMKANPYPEIIRLFHETGLHFDASSEYEAQLLLGLGIPGGHISLSSQQPARELLALLTSGVRYVATSLRQLRDFLVVADQQHELALRVNAGVGAGGNRRTTTGGVTSSFGLWHEYLDEALHRAAAKGHRISRLHMHIGSGADPSVWGDTMDAALAIVRRMPDVTTLDIGGGYKVHRFGEEPETDMAAVATAFATRLENFVHETGRRIQLEIEPGTWLVAHAGTLLASVADIVDTGADGYTFLRLDTGMNDILRPGIYGAQHQIDVLNAEDETKEYVVVGHNCESGDILTPEKGDPESIAPRRMRRATIGDSIAIRDAGAYCASMSVKGYNAFPSAREILL
jgi:diaminopimelate decarboxylase